MSNVFRVIKPGNECLTIGSILGAIKQEQFCSCIVECLRLCST
jgi:hypothetical protein